MHTPLKYLIGLIYFNISIGIKVKNLKTPLRILETFDLQLGVEAHTHECWGRKYLGKNSN